MGACAAGLGPPLPGSLLRGSALGNAGKERGTRDTGHGAGGGGRGTTSINSGLGAQAALGPPARGLAERFPEVGEARVSFAAILGRRG